MSQRSTSFSWETNAGGGPCSRGWRPASTGRRPQRGDLLQCKSLGPRWLPEQPGWKEGFGRSRYFNVLFKGDIQVCERDGMPPPLAPAPKLTHSAAKGLGTLQTHSSFVWSVH